MEYSHISKINKMEKVGVITFYNNYNYGSSLQAFALIKFIERLGYECYLIDFCDLSKPWNRRLAFKNLFNRFFCALIHPHLFLETIKSKKIGTEQKKCSKEQGILFDDFLNNKLNLYKNDFTQSDFIAFVTGSDQVWKLSLPGLHYVFFQRFAKKKQRISYAASLGTDYIPAYNKKLLKKYLKGFSSISLRERNAVSLLSNLEESINPSFVLDPVLLVGREFWESIIPPSKERDYVLIYFLDSPEDNVFKIKNILDNYSLEKVLVINTGISWVNITKYELVNPSPFEFVSLFRNASLILTDSFHGAAFSILFEKEFLIFPRQYKIYPGQNDRILSLLELFNCKDRYINTPTYKDFPKLHQSINEIMRVMRKESITYLKHALENANKS